MTDRYFALSVLLDKDIRSDDAESIINAILMIKHVMKVEPHVSTIDIWAAEERARRVLGEQVLAVLYPKMYEVEEKK